MVVAIYKAISIETQFRVQHWPWLTLYKITRSTASTPDIKYSFGRASSRSENPLSNMATQEFAVWLTSSTVRVRFYKVFIQFGASGHPSIYSSIRVT